MISKFNKGSELDKQIYKEGECTWGCKDGWLDVEDVRKFLKQEEGLIFLMQNNLNIAVYKRSFSKETAEFIEFFREEIKKLKEDRERLIGGGLK